jgi:hypothetical protein
MQCPRCGGRTEVCETRGPFRDRHCTNVVCGIDFTTREDVMSFREHRRPCARTRATQMGAPHRSPAAGGDVRSDPLTGADGVQEGHTDRQAEAGA